MITLKVLKTIFVTNVQRFKGDTIEVSKEQIENFKKAIKFDDYFEVIKLEKKIVKPKVIKK
jgi:hypothetical protein